MTKAGTKFLLELCVAALLLCDATHRFFVGGSSLDPTKMHEMISRIP